MIVNVYSDYTPKATLEVSHSDGNNSQQRFLNEWRGVVDGLKELYPDNLSVVDVEDTMQKSGWNITELKVIEVDV